MPDLEFFVTDDRYSVPSLFFVTVRSVRAARAQARRLLTDNPQYRLVEVREGDKLLFSVRAAGPSVSAASLS